MEEVKEINYLGYIMKKNGGAEKHINERIRRVTTVIKTDLEYRGEIIQG